MATSATSAGETRRVQRGSGQAQKSLRDIATERASVKSNKRAKPAEAKKVQDKFRQDTEHYGHAKNPHVLKILNMDTKKATKFFDALDTLAKTGKAPEAS